MACPRPSLVFSFPIIPFCPPPLFISLCFCLFHHFSPPFLALHFFPFRFHILNIPSACSPLGLFAHYPHAVHPLERTAACAFTDSARLLLVCAALLEHTMGPHVTSGSGGWCAMEMGAETEHSWVRVWEGEETEVHIIRPTGTYVPGQSGRSIQSLYGRSIRGRPWLVDLIAGIQERTDSMLHLPLTNMQPPWPSLSGGKKMIYFLLLYITSMHYFSDACLSLRLSQAGDSFSCVS